MLEVEARRCEGLEELLALRMEFIREVHPEYGPEDVSLLEAKTRDWMIRHLAAGLYVGYVGRDDGHAVCTAGLLFYELPPLSPQSPFRLVGHVLNFWTRPAFRHRGHGRTMMEFMKADAHARGAVRLFLNATAMGEPLYRSCGFGEQVEKALVLNF